MYVLYLGKAALHRYYVYAKYEDESPRRRSVVALELMSKELNLLVAILHVYAGGLILMK